MVTTQNYQNTWSLFCYFYLLLLLFVITTQEKYSLTNNKENAPINLTMKKIAAWHGQCRGFCAGDQGAQVWKLQRREGQQRTSRTGNDEKMLVGLRLLLLCIHRSIQGLLVALQNASPKSLVVVFTDNGSKDLMLEKDIVRLRKSKEIEVGRDGPQEDFHVTAFMFRCSSFWLRPMRGASMDQACRPSVGWARSTNLNHFKRSLLMLWL